jgi:hypothetical protein
MTKKLLVLPILLFSLSILYAQQLPLDISNDATKNKNTNLTFKQASENFERYFATKDTDKKGSGYKPFKRWEYHWSQYLQEDGTIAPAKHLWKAWEQKQQMTKSAKVVSNWTTKGPFSQSRNSGQGRVNTVVVDPNNANTIYVGAPAGGLWKSTDAGVNWTPLTDDLPQIGISGIAIDPDPNNLDSEGNSKVIYISTGDDDAGDSFSVGVLKSLDGGATWTQTGNIAGNPISSNEIIIDPSNSNRVWVATGSGLFLSTDAGLTWVNKQSGHIRDFKLKPGSPNTIYAVSRNTFYRSINGGTSFSVITIGLPLSNTLGRLKVEVTPAAPNNVYLLTVRTNWAFEGIYKSVDSGTTFSKTNQSANFFGSGQAWYDLAFSVSNTDANTMFVGVLDIWKSTNGGDNFTKINSWFQQTPSFTHADIHFIRHYNGVIYVGSDGGVYRSTNNGTTFTDLTTNMSISQFYKVTVSKQNSNKLAGGLQDNGGFSLTNSTWHNYHGGDGMDSASDPNDENTFYGFMQFGQNLFKTNDGGLTGSTVTSGPSNGNWITPLVVNKGSELYAGYSQLYKLENDSWTQISNYFFGGNLEVIEIDPSNNDIIYVSRGRTLYKSIDKGITFTVYLSSQTGLSSGTTISSIEIHNTNSDIVWITTAGASTSVPSSGHTGGSVYKSTDGGQSFTNITDNLPNESKFVIRHHIYSPNNSIYVGTALGVYYRDDIINTWEVFSTNLPNVAVTDIEINPYDDTITASTYGRSVWQSSITTTTFPSIEIDFLNISSPNNSVSCGEVSPQFNVFNNGTNVITSLTVNYNIDSDANQVFNWSGSIAPNNAAIINLPTSSSLTEGEHTLNATIVLANDANQSNNSSQSSFTVNQTSTGQYINTFGDVNPDQWIAHNLWEIDTPTTTSFNNVVTSGYVTNASGNYSDNTIAYLYSPCYNLAMLENPVLKFKMVFDIEINWDVLYIEYSLDQGTTWQVLGTAADPNWYNSSFIDPNRALTIGKQWTGIDNTLKEYSYDLVALTNESSILFRFKFASDQNTNNEGVVIDDFVIDATAILAINDFDKDAFSIYPNPSSDIFNIRRINGNGEEMKLQVFDVTGKLIRNHTNITDNNYKLDMVDVAKGVYFMRISIDNKQLVKKLIFL